MHAIRQWWAKSTLNKLTLLMSFSLVFCCCGWTGRIGGGQPAATVSAASSAPAGPAAPRLSTGWGLSEGATAGEGEVHGRPR